MSPMPSLFTPDTLADRWACSRVRVLSILESGKLPFFRLGRGMERVRGDVLERYEAEHGRPRVRERAKTESFVYFIGCGPFVKIGQAFNVGRRLFELQIANPDSLTLFGSEPGYTDREAELHRQFAEYHHRGEWFRLEGTLAAYIKALPK